jgi:hypothetical protein
MDISAQMGMATNDLSDNTDEETAHVWKISGKVSLKYIKTKAVTLDPKKCFEKTNSVIDANELSYFH